MELSEDERASRETWVVRNSNLEDLSSEHCFRDKRYLALDISEEEAGIYCPEGGSDLDA
jgi:hypothetical protein